jgi:hypothetical protein
MSCLTKAIAATHRVALSALVVLAFLLCKIKKVDTLTTLETTS